MSRNPALQPSQKRYKRPQTLIFGHEVTSNDGEVVLDPNTPPDVRTRQKVEDKVVHKRDTRDKKESLRDERARRKREKLKTYFPGT